MSYKSRPQRLSDIVNDLNDLLSEYVEWSESMPENLEDSPTAQKLQDTIDTMENVISDLEGLDLPLGFGND
tara:strand:+ start:323 stop:535 length:213 start_codon:yes stop_codon:yes gene_type:complete